MANNIKGIFIEIGASTDKLTNALKDVNKQSIGLTKELKEVEKALKFDPGNVRLVAQQQELLSEQIEVTTKKLNTLKGVQDQVEKQFKNGDISAEQYRAFNREVEKVEGSLQGLKNKLDQVTKANTDVNKLKKSFEGVGTAAKDAGREIGNAVGTIGAATAAGAAALINSTQDYNTILAKVRTNAAMIGEDAKIVEEAFRRITTITGEEDSAGEMIANILASGYKGEDILKMADQINGAAIKHFDTLKGEGIADGIQETLATGSAIGQWSELLARSGIDVDKWNEGLAESKKNGTELDYVMQTMANLGFDKVLDQYKEMNPELIANAEASADLKKALGDLAIALTPLITAVTKVVTSFANWAANNPTLAKTFVIISAAIGGISAVIFALSPIISALIPLFVKIGAAVANAGGVMAVLKTVFVAITGPIGIVVAAVLALIAIFVALYKNNEDFRNKVQSIWKQVQTAFKTALDFIMNLVKTVMTAVSTFFGGQLDKIKEFWSKNGTQITNIAKGFMNLILSIIQNVMNVIKGVFQAVWPIISGVIQYNWNLIKTIIKTAIDLVLGIIQTFLRIFQGDWKGAFNTIKDTASNIMKNIKDTFKNIDLFQIGKDIINGLIKGIGSMIKGVGGIVKEIGNKVKDTFTGMFQIKSPSRVFKGYGININEGLAIGLNDSTNLIQKAMDNVYSTLAAGSSLGNSYNTNTNDYSRNMTNNITISAASGNSARDIERVMRRMAFEF